MASLVAINSCFSPSLSLLINHNPNTSQTFQKQLLFSPLLTSSSTSPRLIKNPNYNSRLLSSKPKATLDQELLQEEEDEEPNNKVEVEESVKVLKNAAKTRKVKAEEVLAALSVIQKAKLDPSEFLQTLGGTESPGNTWMLIFTSQDKLTRGSYFPITAIQRFDAAAKRIENGVYLGPVGRLTFEGKFSWKKRILAFVFEYLRIKVGPFGPLQISLGQSQDREPNTKDPFFIWFYVDEEIAVAQGKGGGTAFWCRCRRLT
ncbi:microbial collagenase [Thalictrum thalictroides]|uniref:Microbial collagenase n=1 Tax=Thalictrum thalictroides TaxID=46969 RepID=A0A7J6V9N2_THATH|nr:microbial collagenase [Thalictrum thalictroides]